MINKLAIKSDTIGALSSGLCLAHCITTPLIFLFQPLTSQFEKPIPFWWKILDFIFLFISFFAVYWSSKNSSKSWVKIALWFSWILLTAAILNEKVGVFHLPELAVYIPAISLVFLHFYNRKYCTCSDESCCAN
ncbi:MAG: MerC domain-containing protein [Flavobacteriaceae bacterium]|nr:MerC domain-containing protein [Flavobacteriaceae bacterium]